MQGIRHATAGSNEGFAEGENRLGGALCHVYTGSDESTAAGCARRLRCRHDSLAGEGRLVNSAVAARWCEEDRPWSGHVHSRPTSTSLVRADAHSLTALNTQHCPPFLLHPVLREAFTSCQRRCLRLLPSSATCTAWPTPNPSQVQGRPARVSSSVACILCSVGVDLCDSVRSQSSSLQLFVSQLLMTQRSRTCHPTAATTAQMALRPRQG